jgi:transcriptional regulator with XRE-family HTH domain
VDKTKGIPSHLIAAVIEEYKGQYGATYPLYGNETVRHDISGSVRPLLSSTEIPIEKIVAERSGISKKTLSRILANETEFITEEMADRILTAIDRADVWYNELDDYR